MDPAPRNARLPRALQRDASAALRRRTVLRGHRCLPLRIASHRQHPRQRAAHGQSAPLKHMCVDLGRTHVRMTELVLDSADIRPALQQLSPLRKAPQDLWPRRGDW